MARERPRSAVVAPAGGGGEGGGEGSDGDSSLEEITADDFKKDAPAAAAAAAAAPRSRVWVGYPMSRSYAPAFHSFAWAQAVQNKPLVARPSAEEEEEVEHEVAVDSSDGEKEEGEIEEGEAVASSPRSAPQPVETIDLDAEAPEKKEEKAEEAAAAATGSTAAAAEEDIDFDQRVGTILEELEMVTIEEAEKSFEAACSRLRKCFESLKPMFPETGSPMPMLDALVQQAFVGINTVTTVASSLGLPRREQNKDLLLKLLFHIKNRYSDMLTPDQRNELDSRVRQLVFEDRKDSANANREMIDAKSGRVSSEKLKRESSAENSFSTGRPLKLPKLEIPGASKNKVVSPLLDLHADYDESSLPSPTREDAPPFPVPKPIGFGAFPVAPAQPSFQERDEPANSKSCSFLTDPLNAFSTYQQKYNKKSAFMSDDLPSPTPSGGGDTGGDTHGEVSSYSAPCKTAPMFTSQFPVSRPSSGSDGFAGGPPGYAKQGEQLVSGQHSALKPALRSRDPRLRFVNQDNGTAPDSNRHVSFAELNATKRGIAGGALMNNQKHRAVDEPPVDGSMFKRAVIGVTDPRDTQVTPARGGWIEDGSNVASNPSGRFQPNHNTKFEMKIAGNVDLRTDSRLNNNINSSGTNARIVEPLQNISAPQSNASSTVSLPALLKDIAVNPTMLVQLLQMEQQKRLASEAQQNVPASASTSCTVSNSVTAGAVLPSNSAPKGIEAAHNPNLSSQMPAQTAPLNSQNHAGVIRMKPRDPRRILHNNTVQMNETVGSEQVKTNGTVVADSQSSKDRLTVREQQGEQQQSSASPSEAVPAPNVSQPTKNPRNPANMISNSQLAATSLLASQSNAQQSSGSMNSADPGAATGQNNLNANIALNPATGAIVPSGDPWGGVDHLLDGYDDEQKALIQKERTRRIMEQHKMFAARKLCLVLDLDHTLLNSAKFIEVDPIHEEILRKKEEQDRERPQRHLFRFQHMGMWTKLRPGIWNFLEKASKLYELHLYTMGNKLYATEMAKVLDPTGSLFAGRVISRGDDGEPFDGDERVPKSKDLDGVLGMESAVVIIDDSVRVWPHNKHNLIVVERYTYFPCSRRQFGLPGPSLLEIDRDERPEDGTLASSLAVIERIHQNFFSHHSLNDADVRSILAAEQQSILAGCRIVFSRIFPVGEVNPHLHPLWQTAQQFGAVCTTQIDEQVTHVVANSLGTDKVNWALSTGRFVVHPGWVEASALLYRRANEQDFSVK